MAKKYNFIIVKEEKDSIEVCRGGDSPYTEAMYSKEHAIYNVKRLAGTYSPPCTYTVVDLSDPKKPLSYICKPISGYTVDGLE